MAIFSKLFQAAGLSLLAQQALAAQLYASHYSGSIHLLDFTDGVLSEVSSVPAGSSLPAWLTWDYANRNLYEADEVFSGDGSLTSWSSAEDGSLEQTGHSLALFGAVHNSLFGGADGAGFIGSVHYEESKLTTFALPLTADSVELESFQYEMDGPGPNPDRQTKPHPHQVIADPTGSFLIIPDLGADILRTYAIDQESGKLTACADAIAQPGAGPRHAAFWTGSSSRVSRRQDAGTKVFIADELSNTISRWAVAYSDADACPTLTLEQTLTPYADNATAPTGTKVGEVKVFGNHVYSSNRNDKSHDGNCSLTHYTIAADGAITFAENTNAFGTYPRTFDISEAGDFVAIGDQTTSNVAIVARDVETGALGELVANLPILEPGTPESEDGLSAVVWIDGGS
ncbi:hypothetical protein FQN55_005770 [Onygenales sp. PD_40]|nr:hypothetical protein FQN55_005770 [Onygenales sp. PD_40]KAK2783171.1 hypothetical protein FQN52_000385 [Onygenales sp. PD_12]